MTAVSAASRALGEQGPSAAPPPAGAGPDGRSHAARPPRLAGAVRRRPLRNRLPPDAEEEQFQQAIVLAYGMRFEALADDGVVVAGQPVKVSLLVSNHGPSDVWIAGVDLAGLSGASASCATTVKKAASATISAATATIPADAKALGVRTGHRGAMPPGTTSNPDVPFGVPFRPSPFKAAFRLLDRRRRRSRRRVLQFRYEQRVRRREADGAEVVPAFNVRVSPDIAVIPERQGSAPAAVRQVHGDGDQPAQGGGERRRGGLQAPAGWTVTPASAPVSVRARGRRGDGEVLAVAAARRGRRRLFASPPTASEPHGVTSRHGYEVVEYPHIQRQHMCRSRRRRASR